MLVHKRLIKPSNESSTALWSQTIIGVQVGLIILAMVVTRSSVVSLQAKQGLPIGNQVVGWLVLGKKLITRQP